jgi:gluconate 2-dehydrogenase gamma chain
MANQSPDRREVLEMLALAGMASRFPGFSRWICAPQHEMDDAAGKVHPRPHAYKPLFFGPDEFRAVDQMAELVIPRDDGPGARDAGVSEFIDFMAANDADIQKPFREGLRWMEERALREHGAGFVKLTEEQQAGLLRAAMRENTAFFRLMRRYTVMGYYTSRMGLEQLGYPGLKFYSASPECPHTGDREHKRLSGVRA